MTRAGEERAGRVQGMIQTLIVPLWAAITAALGSYYGVLRTIGELEAEVRVVQTEYRARTEAIERRLEKIETELPKDIATQGDLNTIRQAVESTAERWVERHEQVYHHQTRRRTE